MTCVRHVQNALVGGIYLNQCRGVTLHGPATLTYTQSQYPYAQGTIKTVSTDGLQYNIQVSRALCQSCIQSCVAEKARGRTAAS